MRKKFKKQTLLYAFFAFLLILSLFSAAINPVKAALGDGASSNIRMYETNGNGKINQIIFDIANPNLETWSLNGASPYGLSVTQNGNAITISQVQIISGASANPVVIQIDLDQTDTDLVVDTDAVNSNPIELIYTQAGYGSTPNIQDSVDEELNAINSGDTGATDTEIDNAKPALLSAFFRDVITPDGQVDRVDLTFSETVQLSEYDDSDWTFPTAGDINITNETNAGANANQINLPVSANNNITGCSTTLPTIQYTAANGTANSLKDNAATPNAASNFGPATVGDAAAPYPLGAFYKDTDTDGTVDRIDIVMSSDVGLSCSFEAGDWSFPTPGSINVNTPSGCSILSNSVLLNVSADAYETGGTTDPTVRYQNLNTPDSIADASGNGTGDFGAAGITALDNAAPALGQPSNNPAYLDNDGDGVIDEIHVLFTETVTVNYTDAEWIVNPQTLANGLDTTGVNVNNNSVIEFSVSAGSIATGVGAAGTRPTLQLSGAAGSVVDGSGHSLSSFGPLNIFDLAEPVVSSTSPANGATNVNISSDIVINFSEPMDTTFVYGNEYSSNPNPTGWSSSWSNANKTVNLSHSDYSYSTGVSIDTDETQIDADSGAIAALGLNITGAAPASNDWSFTTQGMPAGGGGGASSTPTGVSVIINDDAASTDSVNVSLSLSGSNVSYMKISNLDDLNDASWETFVYDKDWTLSEGSGTKTVYAKFRSSSGNESSIVSDTIEYEPAGEEEPAAEEPTEEAGEETGTPMPEGIQSNDLIKGSSAAVYYVGADGKRYVFTNQNSYMTWYSDFSGVKTVSDSVLAELPIGGNVTYKPGVKMIKIQSDNKVYAVDQNGLLHWIENQSLAQQLYGNDWTQKIDDVSPVFWPDYTVGDSINSVDDYDPASLKASIGSINQDKGLE